MSHPNPSHDRSNEYPEDGVTHFKRKKKHKVHSVDSLLGYLGKKTGLSPNFIKTKAIRKKAK